MLALGASGAAAAASSGASAGTVTGEEKKAQEEAKRRMERIQAALTQLGSGDDMKEVRDKLNQEMSRAKKASEPLSLNTSRTTMKARRHGCRGKPGG